MKTKRIILAGGPGTGKSTIINSLSKKFPCMKESFREHLQREKEEESGIDFLNTPLEFSYFLYKSRLEQFELGKDHEICFYDRSLWDILIYLDLDKTEYPKDWEINIKNKTYENTVFYFPIWEKIYKKDSERLEDLEQAKKLDIALREGYIKAGFSLIEVPIGTVKERTKFIIEKCRERKIFL